MSMLRRTSEAAVSDFLRDVLKPDAVGVPNLDVMAREAGLLGERQQVTQAKLFRRAKRSLGIRSVRNGFGAGAGGLETYAAVPREGRHSIEDGTAGDRQ